MSSLKISVHTLMGLVASHIPLATVTDKKSGRVFEVAAIKLNIPAVTLNGGVEANTQLPVPFLNMLVAPQHRQTKEWITNWSDEFRINAEFVCVREKTPGGLDAQAWAVRIRDLRKAQLKKLIAASELNKPNYGPIIPRFVMEVGAVRDADQALQRGYAMRPAGFHFSSKPAKGKSKGAKPRPA